ncbi:uncharacterized protein LOC125663865 [Ostrea edulis]|uniref:uncharacterized protein LOC125663865 n=1 Tax=Ostrea edulis TaxID=37623 RepID=UPI0024AF2ACF|nr:uncharacterized protein LOC125663865 [Ostrea edulis]
MIFQKLAVLTGLVFLSHCFGISNQDTHRLEHEARLADKMVVDQEELLKTNTGFRDLTRAGLPQKRVVGVISAVSASFSLLKGIADNVDFSRVCVIGLKNLGNRKLVNPTWYLSHGVIRQPLPRYLPAGDAGIFTFEKSSYAIAGTSGVLTYTISGTTHQVAVFWSVPFVYGIYSNELHVQVWNNAQANEALFKSMEADEEKLTVWNSGHWLKSSSFGITVNAAMTNAAKASLLVEVEFNLTSTQSEIFG